MAVTAADIVEGELAEAALRSAEQVLGLDPDTARAHLAILQAPQTGLYLDEGVDEAAFSTLLELRRRFLPDTALEAVTLAALLS